MGKAPQTLQAVYDQHFAATASTGCISGCHGVGSGGLTFNSATSFYAATVGKASTSQPSRVLIAPGSPSTSVLYQRISPQGAPRMPSGGPYLDAAGLDAVAGWICAGAPPLGGTGGGAGGGTGGGAGGGGAGGGMGGGAGGGVAGPAITQLSPASGYVGTPVTITGSGFSATPASNTVQFNGTAAVVSSASATALQTHVPTGASTGAVTVAVAGQTATSASPFTVLVGNAVPQISALSPCGKVAGAGAFTLTIDGTNFLAGTTATFNGAAVTTTFVSSTQLTAAIPASAIATAPSGNQVSVVVTNPTPGGGASTPMTFGVANAAATLSATVQPIFTASCASVGCHTAAASAGGLNLVSGAAYGELVGVPSSACAPKLRVKACAPSRADSVLIDKVLATAGSPPCAGTAMPKGAPLTAAEKQKLVDWVAQGAPQ